MVTVSFPQFVSLVGWEYWYFVTRGDKFPVDHMVTSIELHYMIMIMNHQRQVSASCHGVPRTRLSLVFLAGCIESNAS